MRRHKKFQSKVLKAVRHTRRNTAKVIIGVKRRQGRRR